MIRFDLFIVGFTLSSIFHCHKLSGDENQKESQAHAFTMNMIGHRPIHVGNFSFGVVVPGETLEAVVLVNNATTGDVQFEKVDLACKCTTAKVPMVNLANGEEVELRFRIETSVNPRVAEDSFSAVVTYSGRSIIKFNFKARYKGLVAFVYPELNVQYLRSDRNHSFRLPLEFESTELMEKARIETSDALKAIQTKLVHDDEKYGSSGILVG